MNKRKAIDSGLAQVAAALDLAIKDDVDIEAVAVETNYRTGTTSVHITLRERAKILGTWGRKPSGGLEPALAFDPTSYQLKGEGDA